MQAFVSDADDFGWNILRWGKRGIRKIDFAYAMLFGRELSLTITVNLRENVSTSINCFIYAQFTFEVTFKEFFVQK